MGRDTEIKVSRSFFIAPDKITYLWNIQSLSSTLSVAANNTPSVVVNSLLLRHVNNLLLRYVNNLPLRYVNNVL